MIQNMNDIRAMLCEEIQNLRDKSTTAANVNAVVNATGKILSTIKMEIEYAKLLGKQPDLKFITLSENVTIERPTGAAEKAEPKRNSKASESQKELAAPHRP